MKQVNAQHYKFSAYVTGKRFASYYNQIRHTLVFNPKSVLEIGPGPGITTTILRQQQIKVTTVDFADDVGADVVASATDLPFKINAFDVVMCCQVLEHLPYESFTTALNEISRVCRLGAVLSLPNAGRYWPYSLHLPKLGTIQFGINLNLIPKAHKFDGQHFWEISKKGYPLNRIQNDIKQHFSEVTSTRYVENIYHHFFICKK